MTSEAVPRVPIPPRGVDYRNKVVLAPMVRSGELPSRLLALQYGADLVWGPETIDQSMIGTTRRVNERTGCIEWSRLPSNSGENVKPSIIFRMHPEREGSKLIYQMGTCKPERAVEAARIVAADVAGIDVNAGCPKSFSTDGGMGAALLKTPDKLVAILEALVANIVPEFGIGISVKIRILKDPKATEALVRRLVRTGIIGLTVHCRTTPMRPRERAIRDQLPMIRAVCHEAGVACLMNGDVTSRDQALELMAEYGVDGAMIATAAEKNSSCFRSKADGGRAEWSEVVESYLRHAIDVGNKFGNTKYLLAQLVPGRHAEAVGMFRGHSYSDVCAALGYAHLMDKAREVDEALEIDPVSLRKAKEELERQKRQRKAEANEARRLQGANANANASAAAAGGNMAEARSSDQQHKRNLSERGPAASAAAATAAVVTTEALPQKAAAIAA
ncbi:tRNA-dihydrouridine synthase 2 [Sporothrix brasiliensis 5110]|uniref:tRNA-dihydrouridine synthase 2 n=1 Tax=Sporothrix brasiliensis 5110 TaxID=1398154 RepID=A0A0C2IUD7_9PEZI|nr:tRNA-dihydrouridine synthase 2 [Sporothrix brasiliensis 5110]KIH90375.1 tRNA-dihydrouridine synthase 2 [Sporothrix brasiliensis 5110]